MFVLLQVKCGDRHQLLPDNLERFDRVVCVLGREAIISGRHYWEVKGTYKSMERNISGTVSILFLETVSSCDQCDKETQYITCTFPQVEVGGKTDWDLGVARQSINRKGKVEVTPSNGYWFLSLRDK